MTRVKSFAAVAAVVLLGLFCVRPAAGQDTTTMLSKFLVDLRSGTLGVNSPLTSVKSAIFATSTATFVSSTAPTVSGFGGTPSVPSANGTAAFTINVGTGGVATTGTINFPTATTGWVVTCFDVTTPDSFVTNQTGGTTSTATVTSYSRTTGVAAAWTASDVLRCMAHAY